MKIGSLVPKADMFELFNKSRLVFVPEVTGCYVLTDDSGTILYFALSKNLRLSIERKFNQDFLAKQSESGPVSFVYWKEYEEICELERSWSNFYFSREGWPPLMQPATVR